MADLLARRRAARETTVEAGGHKWTLRRPTDYERLRLENKTPFEIVCGFVVGWSLTGVDLVPGGDPTPVPFDAELAADYLADHPELWGPLTQALADAIKAHDDAREGAAKN